MVETAGVLGADSKGVWAVLQPGRGALLDASVEALSLGRTLADELGQDLTGLLLGWNIEEMVDTVSQHGADRIYLAEHPSLESWLGDLCIPILTNLIANERPRIVLAAHTVKGAELVSGVAARLRVELASDCIDVRLDRHGLLCCTRLAYSGKVAVSTICPHTFPQIASVRLCAVEAHPPRLARRAELVRIPLETDSTRTRARLLHLVRPDPSTLDVREASVVVAGGRGVGTRENFKLIVELADALGGAVAGTRVARELGWIPFERQIGQTARTVAPELLIACGISGAMQFTAGMKDSRRIIAINTDRRAPIFEIADVKIVGDLLQVVPALIGEVRKQLR